MVDFEHSRLVINIQSQDYATAASPGQEKNNSEVNMTTDGHIDLYKWWTQTKQHATPLLRSGP